VINTPSSLRRYAAWPGVWPTMATFSFIRPDGEGQRTLILAPISESS
jgi:hypothetical protein